MKIRDFIAQREAEIRDLQKSLKQELRELQLAKEAIESSNSPVVPGSSDLTIKQMARIVLSEHPGGLNSSGILDGIKKKFGREIERTSLSPQLTRLKEDKELMLEDEVWFTSDHFAARAKPAKEIDVLDIRDIL